MKQGRNRTISICVSDIPKERLLKHENGKVYMNLSTYDYEERDRFDNDFSVSMALTKEEIESPERFKYPLEIENKTRLNREETRSIQLENHYIELLGEAQSDFEKAISLDPSFAKSYINLACIYDLLDNPDNAIGTIKRLNKTDQNTVDSKMILAIAYFHSNRESLSESIWKELNL